MAAVDDDQAAGAAATTKSNLALSISEPIGLNLLATAAAVAAALGLSRSEEPEEISDDERGSERAR